jgi:tetratricopeptide (TPR) repeat protein
VILAISFCSSLAEAVGQSDDARLLTPNESIEREIAGGERHRYRVSVAGDQFVAVALRSKGIDLALRLYGPNSQKDQPLTEQDEHNELGIERVIWVAKGAGNYWLEVLPVKRDAAAAGYEIGIEEIRPVAEMDEHRVAANWALARGKVMEREDTAQALQKALTEYDAAIAAAQLGKHRAYEAEALSLSAYILDRFGKKQPALDRYNQALTIYRELNDRDNEATAQNNLGLLYNSIGNPTKAIELFTQALGRYRELKKPSAEATALKNIGMAYEKLGEMQKALDHYRQALDLARGLKDRLTEATALNGIGLIYDALGEYQKAIEFFSQALPIARELRSLFGEAVTLNNVGLAWFNLRDFPQATGYLEQSLALRRKAGDPAGEARTLNTLGRIYQELGQFDKAREYFSRSLELFKKSGEKYFEGIVLHNIACEQADRREYQEALKNFFEALSLFQAVGARHSIANTLSWMAKAHAETGEFERARTEIESAIAILESLRAQFVSQDARASYLAVRQNTYEVYTGILMQLHSRRPSEGLNAAALRASELARSRSLLDLLSEARLNLREGADPALLERERQLRREFNAKAAEQLRLPKTENNREQAETIEKSLSALGMQLKEIEAKIRQSNPRYAGLTLPQPITVSEIQNRLLDESTVLLEFALGTRHSWMWAVTPSMVESFRLPPRQEIEAAARKLYGLLIARQPRKNETFDQYTARVAEAEARFQTEAHALSRMLLGQITSKLNLEWKGKRLAVITSGALDYLPFGALPLPESGRAGERERGRAGERESGRAGERGTRGKGEKERSAIPLIAEHEIVTLPSASVLAEIRRETERRTAATKTVAVVADPVFEAGDPRVILAAKRRPPGVDIAVSTRSAGESQPSSADSINTPLLRAVRSIDRSSLSRLPFSREEAETIASLVPPKSFMKATDFRASRDMVMNGDLGDYRIVHFATHGLLNSQHPELAGLVLSLVDENGKAQDGFLRMHEIYNLRFPADVIVLSACQTGLGKEIKGEGLIGLTRGFMYAGAERVVASLWQVDDLATAELMKRFYRGMLKDGMRPAAALRAAQLEMMKQKRWGAPYFWAAFVLQGEWK